MFRVMNSRKLFQIWSIPFHLYLVQRLDLEEHILQVLSWDKGKHQWSLVSFLSVPSNFEIPHSLSLDEKNRRLFVADRENSRVLQFDSVNGHLVREIKAFGERAFAVHYHPEQGMHIEFTFIH